MGLIAGRSPGLFLYKKIATLALHAQATPDRNLIKAALEPALSGSRRFAACIVWVRLSERNLSGGRMRVLFTSSEVYPLAKTGGLADVSGALPPALAALGADLRLLMPAYPQALAALDGPITARTEIAAPFGLGKVSVLEAPLPGHSGDVKLLLLDCPALYDRPGGPYQDETGADHADNARRFGLLSWVAARLSQTDSPLGWVPHILHLHDWQTALAAAYLHAWGGPRPAIATTIHNMAYQGLFPADTLDLLELPRSLFTIDGVEFWNQVSFLKAGLVYGDSITTVSPSYAREIQSPAQGCGLEGLLSARAKDLHGILNGADYATWDPSSDPLLNNQRDAADFTAKAAAKAALQREFGLPEQKDAPLFVIVSRLTAHKGMDMVLAAIPALLQAGGQLAVLGTGEKALEDGFRAAATAHGEGVSVRIGYSETTAHRLIDGGDVLLMPSRSEPCGLTQFYSFRYGTLPLVHRTGGLADSVVDTSYDSLASHAANGFVFPEPNLGALTWCIERAVAMYRIPDRWNEIRRNAIALDFGWARSAARYMALYGAMMDRHGSGGHSVDAP